MSDFAIFALGKLGGPVRVVMQCQLTDAFAAKYDDEVVMRLNSLPREPVMISLDGTDVVAIPETPEQRSARLWQAVRTKRNGLLDSSRWAVAADSALTRECQSEWLDYLKALNRVTIDFDDPAKVVWPVPPAKTYA